MRKGRVIYAIKRNWRQRNHRFNKGQPSRRPGRRGDSLRTPDRPHQSPHGAQLHGTKPVRQFPRSLPAAMGIHREDWTGFDYIQVITIV